MEADDSRFRSDERSQHRVVFEKAAIDFAQSLRGPRAELLELRPQLFEPRRFAGRIGLRRAMTEHIHVERAAGARAEFRDHSLRAFGIGRADADRSQRPGIRDRSRQRRRGNSGHRRLDERQVDPQ
jgi:hypothetical protein